MRSSNTSDKAACASTIGSSSTMTIRASGATACATSWVLPAVGSPVPIAYTPVTCAQ